MTLALSPADRPVLPRGVRLHHDNVRGRDFLLAPEKAIELDVIGLAILSRVTGDKSFGDLVMELAQAYDAPVERIEQDVQRFLSSLRARLYVTVAP